MPKTNFSEEDALALRQKEYDRKLNKLKSQYGMGEPKEPEKEKKTKNKKNSSKKKDEENKSDEISIDRLVPGIRVKHDKSQLIYTVAVVDKMSGFIELRTPEGRTFKLSNEELEAEYRLD